MTRWICAALLLLAPAPALAGEPPPGIVDVQTVIPDLQLDMRYPTAHNFMGRPVAGYAAARCYLTKRAAEALKGVQDELRPRGLALKVYDCYRPRRAVDDFVTWGKDLGDQKMKAEFYPRLDKRRLFRDGYIASRSGHSRGSTLDLTLVPLPVPHQPVYDATAPLSSCETSKESRSPDSSIDMGTGFDCFSPMAHTHYAGITAEQKANRRLLRSVMARHGFVGLAAEWWHYRLRDEPYPGTHFDFPVE